MDKELLKVLTASALNGIISNEETMREVTKIVNDNRDKNIDFYRAVAEMAYNYALATLEVLERYFYCFLFFFRGKLVNKLHFTCEFEIKVVNLYK